jgi:multiple sugar transport system substrate-binding protein
MSRNRMSTFLVILVLLFSLSTFALASLAQDSDEPVTLTVLTHWGEERMIQAQEAMFDEYMALNPHVTIQLNTVPFEELLTRIITGRTAGTQPDIYHLYNLWLPDFTGPGGFLAVPPEEILEDIIANSPPGVVEGITSNDQVWGYPTEVNTYLLIYNKRLLEEAGYSEPPANWDELLEMATAITEVDDTGALTQVGFGILPGWDSGVVHPFATMLFSNGGEYLNEDFTATAFNSPEGLETLQLYADLIESGGMDLSIAGWDFPNGRVGLVVMANWWRATLIASESVDYETEVGVAPVPVGPSGEVSMTMSYNWLWSVDSSSQNVDTAWDLIRWINTPRDGEGSLMGDFLVNELGAIPSLIFDQDAFADDLSDHFLAPFVESTFFARPEPVVAGGQEVKTRLQTEIEAVLSGMTDPASALEFAAMEGDAILEEMRMMME